MKKILFICLIALTLGACSSNPMAVQYTKATLEKDINEIRKSKEITLDQVDLLVKYINENESDPDIESVEGNTYSLILLEAEMMKELDLAFDDLSEYN